MKRAVFTILSFVALAIPVTTSTAVAAPVHNVLCGPQCGGGGFPVCDDGHIGTQFTDVQGRRYVCVFNPAGLDYWARIN